MQEQTPTTQKSQEPWKRALNGKAYQRVFIAAGRPPACSLVAAFSFPVLDFTAVRLPIEPVTG